MTMSKMIAAGVVIGGVALGWTAHGADAPSFKRVLLQQHDTSVAGREAIQTRGEFGPGAILPRHTHHGEELGYILEGEVVLEVEGKPPVTLKAGDVFFIPTGVPHGGRGVGKGPVKVVATYFVEKGQPLVTEVKSETK